VWEAATGAAVATVAIGPVEFLALVPTAGRW